MFSPTIYLTHKILKLIVDLEKSDLELQRSLNQFFLRRNDTILLDFLKGIAKIEKIGTFSDAALREMLRGQYSIPPLQKERNAVQAVINYEQSLRAEDDWNFLKRINYLLTSQPAEIDILRDGQPKESSLLKSHVFQSQSQMEFTTIEIFRWYRKTEKEVNRYLRFTTLLYELLKISPFAKRSDDTVILCTDFFARENRMNTFRMSGLAQVISEIRDPDVELNEFIQIFLSLLLKTTKTHIFEFEKKIAQVESPKKILNLTPRQLELLKLIRAKDRISRQEVVEILGVSFMTVYRDLKSLQKKKVIEANGNGKNTYYTLITKVV